MENLRPTNTVTFQIPYPTVMCKTWRLLESMFHSSKEKSKTRIQELWTSKAAEIFLQTERIKKYQLLLRHSSGKAENTCDSFFSYENTQNSGTPWKQFPVVGKRV